jgi:hypothetical protein
MTVWKGYRSRKEVVTATGTMNGTTAVDTSIVVAEDIREGALWFDLDGDQSGAAITVDLFCPSSAAAAAGAVGVVITQITFTADADGEGSGVAALNMPIPAGTYTMQADSDNVSSGGTFSAKLFGFS